MNISSDGYIALGVSVLVAMLLDFTVLRLFVQFLRPASVYLFWAGRAGKLVAATVWLLYFTGSWHPMFAGTEASPAVGSVGWVVIAVLVVLAAVSFPRNRPAAKGNDA